MTQTQAPTEVFWRPRKGGKFLAVLFLSDGVTPGGLVGIHHERKLKNLAMCIETFQTNTVEPGDVVLYKEGFAEDLITADGDVFCLIDERDVITIFNNMFLEEDKKVESPILWR